MTDSQARQDVYWWRTRCLTAGLLLIWGLISFLPGWFADGLNQHEVLGWPLGFYMAAQGGLIVFLLVVWVYDQGMRRLEARYRKGDGA